MTIVQSRCAAWARTAVRFIKPGGVAVFPHRLSGGDVVTGHNFLRPSLLLGVKASVLDRERRPTRTNRTAPHLDRRRAGPISFDLHTTNDAVALRTAKARPVECVYGWSYWRRWLLALGKESILGSVGPSPVEIIIEGRRDAAGSKEHEYPGDEENYPDQGGAPWPVRKPLTKRGPHNQSQSKDRDREHVQ